MFRDPGPAFVLFPPPPGEWERKSKSKSKSNSKSNSKSRTSVSRDPHDCSDDGSSGGMVA